MCLCVCVCAGNKVTLETRPLELGLDVREELIKFHSQHYSSNLMTLAVLGRGGSPRMCMHTDVCTCMYLCINPLLM